MLKRFEIIKISHPTQKFFTNLRHALIFPGGNRPYCKGGRGGKIFLLKFEFFNFQTEASRPNIVFGIFKQFLFSKPKL